MIYRIMARLHGRVKLITYFGIYPLARGTGRESVLLLSNSSIPFLKRITKKDQMLGENEEKRTERRKKEKKTEDFKRLAAIP